MVGKIEALSPGERLLIDRRRRSERQLHAAARFGITRMAYGRWERDKEEGDWPSPCPIPPQEEIGDLKPPELCMLHRLRAGKKQREVAEAFKTCRWTIVRIELGLASETITKSLLNYWEQ